MYKPIAYTSKAFEPFLISFALSKVGLVFFCCFFLSFFVAFLFSSFWTFGLFMKLKTKKFWFFMMGNILSRVVVVAA